MLKYGYPGGKALPNYRLYRLDGAGKISAAEWLEAADDDQALRQARTRCTTGTFELWDRYRLVGRR
jgi:hypothetical protein